MLYEKRASSDAALTELIEIENAHSTLLTCLYLDLHRKAVWIFWAELIIHNAFDKLQIVDPILGRRVCIRDHRCAFDGAITIVTGPLHRPEHGFEIDRPVARSKRI